MENKKIISYERIMDSIYRELRNEDIGKNVIETEELQKKLNDFLDRYIEPLLNISYDLHADITIDILEVIFSYCRRGFDVGFKAAITLLENKRGIL